MRRTVRVSLYILLLGGFLLPAAARSQDPATQNPDQKQNPSKQSPAERRKRDKELYKELDNVYKKWLDEDVVYIISPEERQAFLRLSTNEEREQFIEQFWLRRDPTPDTPENEFKEEHYRRIAYANEHFASGIPGWRTDRGRIYIIWGKPDEIESHPTGGSYDRPVEEGGGNTSTYPWEKWRYRYLEGIGTNVELEFYDPTNSGEYRLTMDPCAKDALTFVGNAGETDLEQRGMASKVDRFNNTDGTTCGKVMAARPESWNEFNRIELEAKIFQPPPVKFKDLEPLVTARLVRNQINFDYRFDFLRVTDDTVLVPVTVQIPNRQMTYTEKDGVQSATMNLFARITTIGGRVVQTFEDVITREFPSSILKVELKGSSIYQKAVPLRPGLYRLDIVLKDVNSGNVGVVNARLAVPRYEEDKLTTSSLILADQLQKVSATDIGRGQFVLGDVKVRPKLNGDFSSDDQMGIYLQVYNLKVDDKTHKPEASIIYRVMKDKQEILKFDESSDALGVHGEQLTLEKTLALAGLKPGQYRLEVEITDKLANQTVSPSVAFTVKPPETGASD